MTFDGRYLWAAARLGRDFQGFDHLDKGDTFTADKAVKDVSADDFDALLLPGGVANPDFLRTDEDAVRFVRDFAQSGKPIGVICHGPWTLVEADVVKGRTITSWPSLKTDIRNAGGEWVDQEVVTDKGLVTSRKPDDLPAFNRKMIEEIAHTCPVALSIHPDLKQEIIFNY